MNRVILQPAGDADAQRNLQRTFWSPAQIENHHRHLGRHFRELPALFPSGQVPMWDIRAGRN